MQETQGYDKCLCPSEVYLRRKPNIKFEGESITKTTYVPHQIEKKPNYDPVKVMSKSYDPDVLQSSYNATFTKPSMYLSVVQQPKPDSVYLQKNRVKIPIDSYTYYKKNFQAIPLKIDKQPYHVYQPKSTKFEGESTYKSQFVKQKTPEYPSWKQGMASVKEYLAMKPNIPFEGSSSYKDTFQKHYMKVEKQPEHKYEPKKSRFYGESSYKSTYKQPSKYAYRYGIDHCPVHPDKVIYR